MFKKILVGLPILLLIIAASIYFGINYQAKKQADLLIAQALESGAYTELGYESVKVNPLSGELTLHNLRAVDLQQTEFIITEVVVSDYDFEHNIPQHLNIAIRGFRLPRGLPNLIQTNPLMQPYVNSLMAGDAIPLTINYQYGYEPENNKLINSTVSIGLDNSANISFTAKIQNVPLETLLATNDESSSATQMPLYSYLLAAEVSAVELKVDDLGVLNDLLTIQSQEFSIPTETLRLQLINQVQGLYVFFPAASHQQVIGIGNELSSFLEGNKSLSISIAPEYNGNIQRLQPEVLRAVFAGDYAAIINLMNLNVTTQ